MNGERVDAAGKLIRQRLVDHAVALDPGLSFERIRHDIDTEVSFPSRPVSRMAFMPVGLVFDPQALRRESLGQRLRDEIGSSHAFPVKGGRRAGQCRSETEFCGKPQSSLEDVIAKSAY